MSEKKVIGSEKAGENIGEMATVALPEKASELQALVRDALKTNGIDPDGQGQVPLIQPRTLPMIQPQAVPVKVAKATEQETEKERSKRERAAPTVLVRAPKKSSASTIVLALMGIFVVASAGTAAYLARSKTPVSVASASTQAAPQAPQPSEGAVSFAVGARASDNTATPAATTAAPTPAPDPAPPATTVAASTTDDKASAASDDKPEEKEKKRRRHRKASSSDTASEPTATATAVAAAPAPEKKPDPKPATTAAAAPEKKPDPKPTASTAAAEPKPAATPAKPAAGGVDAILQQQLNSAIP